MNPSHTYRTVSSCGESLHKVQGSNHLGFAFNVRSEDEIREYLNSFRKKHHAATHVCFAWKLRGGMDHYRYSDDGEPSGTAGRPIYNQILHFDLSDVLVIVVRYFGGTKLGTGGLMDAYKTAARLAIENSTLAELPITQRLNLKFTYEAMPQVMALIKQCEGRKIHMSQENEVSMEIELTSAFLAVFLETSSGITGLQVLGST